MTCPAFYAMLPQILELGPYYKPTSQIPLNLLHRCIVLSRPGHHKKRLLNLSKVREGGKARYN